MPDSTDRESLKNDDPNPDAGADSGATSKETLSDLEENQADPGSSSSEVDPGPSPDGALDETGEIKDAGPM